MACMPGELPLIHWCLGADDMAWAGIVCISPMEKERDLCVYFNVGFDWEPCKQLIRSDFGIICADAVVRFLVAVSHVAS